MPKPLFAPGLFCSLKQCGFDFSSGSQCSNFLDWKEVETSFPATARCQVVLTCMYALCLPADTFLASLSSCCSQPSVAAKHCKGALLGQGGGKRQHHHTPWLWAIKGGTNAGAGLMDVQTLLQHLQPSYRSSLNFLALEPRVSLFFMVHRNCRSQISTLLIPRRLRDSSCCNLTLQTADLVQNPYSKQLWSSQLSYELTA